LEGHLQIGNIGGKTGDDGGGGELIDIGKIVGLHLGEHIVAEIPGKAGACVGGKEGRCHTEQQAAQSADSQLK
jgi:hypothetical protein